MNNQWHSFSTEDGIKNTDSQPLQGVNYMVRYKDGFVGQSKLAALEKMGITGIKEIKKGVVWGTDVSGKELDEVLQTNIFYNPFSQNCLKIK